jgi:hypothetical protein
MLLSALSKAENFSICRVYQYSDTNSNKKHLALVRMLNRSGKVVSETYSDYSSSIVERNVDGTYYYYYSDSLLEKRTFIESNGDKEKTVYFYDCHQRCVREVSFRFEKNTKKDIKKGIGQKDGCIVLEKDFESYRTWSKTNEINHFYDTVGRLVRTENEQDYKRVWTYDSLNRISQEKGFSAGRLEYIAYYQHFRDGYRYVTVNYNAEGKPELPEYGDYIFSPRYTSTFYVDSTGKTIRKTTSTEKDVLICEELIFYDAHGRISKTVNTYFDKHFIPTGTASTITHIYEY